MNINKHILHNAPGRIISEPGYYNTIQGTQYYKWKAHGLYSFKIRNQGVFMQSGYGGTKE